MTRTSEQHVKNTAIITKIKAEDPQVSTQVPCIPAVPQHQPLADVTAPPFSLQCHSQWPRHGNNPMSASGRGAKKAVVHTRILPKFMQVELKDQFICGAGIWPSD